MARFRFKALAVVSVTALAVPLLSGQASAAPPTRTSIAGVHPSWATSASDLGAVSASTTVTAQVYLAPNGGVDRLSYAVDALSDPSSSTYRHFLTPDQYRAQFGPTAAQVSAIRSWLVGAGLQVTGIGAGNRYVSISGTAASVSAAFGVALHSYRHNGVVEQAPTSDATVPAGVANFVLGVTGLSAPQAMAPPPAGFRNAHPCSASYGTIPAQFQADGTTPLPAFMGTILPYSVCGYVPSQFRSAYGVTGSGLTGAGVTVAIVDAYASPTILADANQYATQHGDAAFTAGQFTQSLPSLAFRRSALCGASGWYGEETLDVEAVHGIATGANVAYYASRSCLDSDFLDTLQRTVDDNIASFVSNSWGSPGKNETRSQINAYGQVFKQGAMQGIGFLFSSGDSGDDVLSTGVKQTDYPASDPNVTAVGGTSTAIGTSGSISSQFGWGTDKYTLSANGTSWVPVAANPFIYGAGGGFSSLFNRPTYQNGVVPAGSPPGRAVPDIAMDADPTTGMLVGQTQTFPEGVHYDEYRIGGTSLASPLMAGVQALASQKSGGRLGFANPLIYRLARNGAGTFTDVADAPGVAGNVRADFANGLDPSGGFLYSVRTFGDDASLEAVPGWDNVTGVGSPNATYFSVVH